jgi:K+-sensing histidine kinase KdpD
MKSNRVALWSKYLVSSFQTVPLFLIGRATLGEAVIALILLIPVSWSAYKWGQLPGISAALTATLCFNFLFIPPFFTFAIGSLEGWLVLAIFLAVAVIVIGRIQASLSKAHEALYMYELSSALSNQRTPDAVAHAVAREIRMLFQASQVCVIYQPDKTLPGVVYSEPAEGCGTGKPDRIVPLYDSWGFAGEIQIWRGITIELPPTESPLLENFARQAGRAFERTDVSAHHRRVSDKFTESSSGR